MGISKGSDVTYTDSDGKKFQAVIVSEVFANKVLIALDAGDGKAKNVDLVELKAIQP